MNDLLLSVVSALITVSAWLALDYLSGSERPPLHYVESFFLSVAAVCVYRAFTEEAA